MRLQDEDVRMMNVGQLGESEGKRKLSWIWLVQGASDHSDDVALQEGMSRLQHSSPLIAVSDCRGSASHRVV